LAGKDAKLLVAQNLKLGTQKNALSQIVTAVDPRASVTISATFANSPASVSSVSVLQIGNFRFSNIKIGTSKPAQAVGTFTVLDPAALNFNVDSYQFTFQEISYSQNLSYTALVFEVENTGDTEAKLNLSGLSARVFNNDGREAKFEGIWSSTINRAVSNDQSITAPKGVKFIIRIYGSDYNNTLFLQSLTIKPAKYLEFNIKGEQRTFQNIDLRPYIK
jgi:hypothetical protein